MVSSPSNPEPSAAPPQAAAASAPSHRRELKRAYKEAAPARGVFVIRNLVNQRVYLGASRNVDGALNRARFELNLRAHRNRLLAQDWARWGEQNFSFEVIDRVRKRDDPDFDHDAELAELLQMWRDELRATGDAGYNLDQPLRVMGAAS